MTYTHYQQTTARTSQRPIQPTSYMQVFDAFLNKEWQTAIPYTSSVGRAYTYSNHNVPWVLAEKSALTRPRLFSQGQDLHEVSSRILEAKARPRWQQDCRICIRRILKVKIRIRRMRILTSFVTSLLRPRSSCLRCSS